MASRSIFVDYKNEILSKNLSKSTLSTYTTVYKRYIEYCNWEGENPTYPSVNLICDYLTHESIFNQPQNMQMYLSGIKYYLINQGTYKKEIFDDMRIGYLIRGLSKMNGVAERDEREPISTKLLVEIAKITDKKDHNDICCLCASIIGFICCLRIGEVSINSKTSIYIKRTSWSQNSDSGYFKLERSKSDQFGRGTLIYYTKINSSIDPINNLGIYACQNRIWKGREDDPLFILRDGRPLDRDTLVSWLRSKARQAHFPKWDKLNGISFRRGCIQELKEAGMGFAQYGKICRWASEKCSLRYVKVNAEVIKNFSRVFEKNSNVSE